MLESLAKKGIPTYVGGIGAAALIIISGVWLYDGRLPDLRYEEAPYYRPGEEAVALLKLHNYGGSDAKDVAVMVQFPTPILRAPTTDSDLVEFKASFAPGKDKLTATVKRVVPGQTLAIWFVIRNPARQPTEPFVSEIIYEGGKGKSGQPQLPGILRTLLISLVELLILVFVGLWAVRKLDTALTEQSDLNNRLVNQLIDHSNWAVKTSYEHTTGMIKRAYKICEQQIESARVNAETTVQKVEHRIATNTTMTVDELAEMHRRVQEMKTDYSKMEDMLREAKAREEELLTQLSEARASAEKKLRSRGRKKAGEEEPKSPPG